MGDDELVLEGGIEKSIPRFRWLQLVLFQERFVTGEAE
jgi:hypothetical protein